MEPYHPNDTVISFASAVIREKGILSRAITNAKNSCAFDLDAEIECNKLRQTMAASIRSMLRQNKPKRIETGKDYNDPPGKPTVYLTVGRKADTNYLNCEAGSTCRTPRSI